MHAIICRIHPSLRRAFIAWIVIRGLLWLTLARHGGPMPEAGLQLPWESGGAVDPGAPLWVGLQHACHTLADAGLTLSVSGEWILVAICEFSLFIGAVAVYRFTRAEHLPHTAERATWFWLAIPAAAITLPTSAWSLTAGLTAASLACVARTRLVAGGLLLAAATGFRPEAMLIWPGAVWWGLTKDSSDGPVLHAGPWTLALAPPAAFTGSIATTLLMAGDWKISLRSLQPHARWRSELPWWQLTERSGLMQTTDWHAIAPAATTALAAAAVICLLVAYARKLPASWFAVALPPILWPLAHQPPTAAAGSFLLAIPAAAVLGRATDNRVAERALLAACLGALLLAAVG